MNTAPATRSSLATLLIASAFVLISIVTTARLQADTIGYWRFEGNSTTWLNDSSGNNLTLSTNGANGAPTHYTLPANGSGSAIPKNINGLNNASAAKGGQSNDSFNKQIFSADISTKSTGLSSELTFEAFIHYSYSPANTGASILAGQGIGAADNSGWAVSIANANNARGAGNLLFQYNRVGGAWGSNLTTLESKLYLETGNSYYIAITVDFADTTSTGVTVYLQNLGAAGSKLQIANLDHTGGLVATSGTLTIGDSIAGGSPLFGIIDEVRLSDSRLAKSQLLISTIPEPKTAALIAGLAIVFIALVHRRR